MVCAVSVWPNRSNGASRMRPVGERPNCWSRDGISIRFGPESGYCDRMPRRPITTAATTATRTMRRPRLYARSLTPWPTSTGAVLRNWTSSSDSSAPAYPAIQSVS